MATTPVVLRCPRYRLRHNRGSNFHSLFNELHVQCAATTTSELLINILDPDASTKCLSIVPLLNMHQEN